MLALPESSSRSTWTTTVGGVPNFPAYVSRSSPSPLAVPAAAGGKVSIVVVARMLARRTLEVAAGFMLADRAARRRSVRACELHWAQS